ncbi:mechanosensitive ion channel family protein [Candidatus Nanohalobium constans]|nr:mechanosensitive ion channel domain-containing protein [Candidatus Nanohalobium constans]
MPLTEKLMARRNTDMVTRHSFSNLTGITGVFLSFIVALQAAEFGNLVSVLGAITAAATVAVGFGMRDQISNLVAGFMLYLDSPFIKGDYIEVGEKSGVVKEIRLRHTTVKNGESEKTVLPNSMLTTTPLENYSRGKRATASIEFKVENSKSQKLEEMLIESMNLEEDILDKPEPKVNYKGLEEGKTVLEAVFSVSTATKVGEAKKKLNRAVNQKAAEEKLFEKEE